MSTSSARGPLAADRGASASAGPATTIAATTAATTAAATITATIVSECGREQCKVCWGLADNGEAQK
ncbi:hypothetical protein [Bradyrhizobium sp. AZCC 1610]|uniref:hypothetical protein n=1 Tax=Bradyrhizobium sp. AZCC 1610 TaxID=3117020 RepID=UPI002FEF1DF6